MKFYISSRVKDQKKTKLLAKQLKSWGHGVFDWTKYKRLGRPYHNKLRAPRVAHEMVEAIKRTDVFILFPDLRGGTGMFIELGVAIATKKKIFIVTPKITRPIFFFHPLIIHVKSTKKLLAIYEPRNAR